MDENKKKGIIIVVVVVALLIAVGSAYMTYSGQQGHGTPGPSRPAGAKNEKELAMEAAKKGGGTPASAPTAGGDDERQAGNPTPK